MFRHQEQKVDQARATLYLCPIQQSKHTLAFLLQDPPLHRARWNHKCPAIAVARARRAAAMAAAAQGSQW